MTPRATLGGRLSQRLRSLHAAVTARPALAPLMVALFTVAYFAATCDLASLKPFSFDELTTYNIARSPNAGALWTNWLASGDGVPPVAHLATHVAGSALGFSHVTARLPDMIGFWVMSVCVLIFLRRRVGAWLAVLGMLVPVTVPMAYAYAIEDRGYGIVLAFSGAAVVCWDLTRDPRWRPLALLGLPICLAAAVATHLYAILLVVPLAAAELARTVEQRRVDWWVWVGLIAVGLWLLPMNPIVAHIRQLTELSRYASWHRVSVSELMALWAQFLSVSAMSLGLLALVCLWPQPVAADGAPATPPAVGAAAADWVLVLGFIALPVIGAMFAYFVTGLLLFRYVIASVIGFSLGVALLCGVAVRRRPELALVLTGWVAVTAFGTVMATRHAMHTTSVTTQHIAAGAACFRLLQLGGNLAQDGSPIVVSDFTLFHQLQHYAPDPLKARLLFVVDHEFGALIEPYMPYYARVFDERLEGLEDFLRSHRSFYLYDCGAPGRLPLLERLLDAGASVRDAGLTDTPDIGLRRDLYRITLPPAP